MRPLDPKDARVLARADQLREGVRQALQEIGPAGRAKLVTLCASGDLTVFDKGGQQLVGALAVLAVASFFEPPAPQAGAEG